jgi:tungstate transport system substrate-binding protein
MFSARSSTLAVARPSALSIVSTLGLVAASAGCGPTGDSIVLAATTSTYDSGLLDSLVARFKTEHPDYSVRSVVVGSGQALELGRRGDADVLLVHAPEAEERFMADGHGVDRFPVMYNDFVLVGPPDDPAGVRGVPEAARALATIVEAGARFVSRGDDSGTHLREMALWRTAGVAPQGPWYLVSGQGQGTSLQLASERGAYTLVDRATLSTLRRLLRLQPLVQGDPALVNLYSVIRTSRAAHPVEASVFADWLTSEEARLMIANFGSDEAGYPLYTPLVVGATLPIPSTTPKP